MGHRILGTRKFRTRKFRTRKFRTAILKLGVRMFIFTLRSAFVCLAFSFLGQLALAHSQHAIEYSLEVTNNSTSDVYTDYPPSPGTLDIKILDSRIVSSDYLTPYVAATTDLEWTVSLLSESGETLAARTLLNPLEVRTDVYKGNGEFESKDIYYKTRSVFRIVLPEAKAASLAISSINANGAYQIALTEIAFSALENTSTMSSGRVLAEPENTALDGEFNSEFLLYSGDSHEKIDMVIIGDGFAAQDQALWLSEAQRMSDVFFEEAPFDTYQSFFNVRRVDVVSPESGLTGNTPFEGQVGCHDTARATCQNDDKLFAFIEQHLVPTEYDFILLVFNDFRRAGGANRVAVTTINSDGARVGIHEIGHVFGLLNDEYVLTGSPCRTDVEPTKPNLTTILDRETTKWAEWIDPNTPLPTTFSDVGYGVVGLFEDTLFCKEGFYRPTYSSMMKNTDHPFEAVNEQQLVRRIYTLAPIVTGILPEAATVNVAQGQSQLFEVQSQQTSNNDVTFRWTFNGQQITGASTYELNTGGLLPGTYYLTLNVQDESGKVRKDPEGVTSYSHSWQVDVSGSSTGTDTLVEAETGTLSAGARIYQDSSASNGEGVAYISSNGAGFELTDVPAADRIDIYYASAFSGEISIAVNGVDQGNINFVTTGAWEGNYESRSMQISVNAGDTLRVFFESGDTALNVDAVNFFKLIGEPTPTPEPTATPTVIPTPIPTATPSATPSPTSSPAPSPSPASTPGSVIIEAESAALTGNADIYTDNAASGGAGVAYIYQVGDSLTFTNVPAATALQVNFASANPGGSLSVSVNGSDAGNIEFSGNGSWVGNYSSASLALDIPEGATLIVFYDNGDTAMNIDSLVLTTTGGAEPTPTPALYADGDANTCCHSDSNADSDCHTYTHTYTRTYAYTNRDPNGDADTSRWQWHYRYGV